ncbi:MAG TPA: hypothetical protein VNU47_01795 [Candidatus Paceibacterota bacterium]|nr:hypothetical protein [Candidatus Paceibacterota bacterium]
MEEPVTQPPVTPAAPQSTPTFTRTRLIILISVIAVLALIAIAAFVPFGGKSLISRIQTQFELRDLRIGDRSYTDAAMRSFGIFDLKADDAGASLGTVGDYARGGSVEAAIVTADGSQQVWLLGSEPRQLTQSSAGKASLAVSPDGALVAYAARSGGEAEHATQLSAWTMHVIDTATGADVELNSGFDPHFFTRDGVTYLLYTSPLGVEVAERIADGSFRSFLTPFEFADSADFAVKVTADGSYVALKSVASRTYGFFSVYRASSTLPLGLEPAARSAIALGDVVFSNGNAYGFANGRPETVWKVGLNDPEANVNFYELPDGTYRFIY